MKPTLAQKEKARYHLGMDKADEFAHAQALVKFRFRLMALEEWSTSRNKEERERLASVIATYERLEIGR